MQDAISRKKAVGVICGKRMQRKLKVKIYKNIIRLVLLYGAEVQAQRKKVERLLVTKNENVQR